MVDASSHKTCVYAQDMHDDMRTAALESCAVAMEKFNLEKDVANHIKRAFEKSYGPTWHCVAGRSFSK